MNSRGVESSCKRMGLEYFPSRSRYSSGKTGSIEAWKDIQKVMQKIPLTTEENDAIEKDLQRTYKRASCQRERESGLAVPSRSH